MWVMARGRGAGGSAPTVGMHRIHVAWGLGATTVGWLEGLTARTLQLPEWGGLYLLLYRGKECSNTPGVPRVCGDMAIDAP